MTQREKYQSENLHVATATYNICLRQNRRALSVVDLCVSGGVLVVSSLRVLGGCLWLWRPGVSGWSVLLRGPLSVVGTSHIVIWIWLGSGIGWSGRPPVGTFRTVTSLWFVLLGVLAIL